MLKVYAVHKHIGLFKKVESYQTISPIFFHLTPSAFQDTNRIKVKKQFVMHRKWKPELIKMENTDSPDNKSVPNYKLLSYNILAQDLLVEHLHLYCTIDNKMLRWESRLSKLRDEIAILMPDILCLQEMQYDHLKEFVNKISIVNQKRRFEYVFKKKTGIRSDGCAIIYDKNKFKLIADKHVEYYTGGVPTLNRENIAMMVKLQPQGENSATFVVATTHLLFNPRREDVRISQVNKLLQAIIDFSQSSDASRLPVILTGDFNFTPDSRAFQILTALRKPKLIPEVTNNEQNAEDFFQMESIDFGSIDGVSTHQGQWITVDYILKSRANKCKKSIKVNSRYILPSINECCKTGLIPNTFVGSDHFSLAIQFSII